MPINWPSSPSTGDLYTSPNNDVWRWNGYAWDVKNLQSSGNYGAPWVIFDSSYSPNYYATFSAALTAAVVGDTIYLVDDVNESYSQDVILKDKVNVNLNGNVFNFTLSSWIGNCGLSTGYTSPKEVRFQNGTVNFINGTNTFYGFLSANLADKFDLSGLTVILTGRSGGSFVGSLTGGTFINNALTSYSSGVELNSGFTGGQQIRKIYKDIKGICSGRFGILINQILS